MCMSEKIWCFYSEFEGMLYLVQKVLRKYGGKVLDFLDEYVVSIRKIKWYVYVYTVRYFL